MNFSPALVCLSAQLSLVLVACQPSDSTQSLVPNPVASRTSAYHFTGNPGIRTSSVDDITGTLTGTVDGQPIAFGPDKAIPLEVTTGYNARDTNPSFLFIRSQNDQYNISLILNGPFEAGRSYRSYNPADDNGEGKFDAYIVTAYVRPPVSVTTRGITDLAAPNKQVRITALTPDYIDIEFLFTLNKPGAVQERITMRIKNRLDENRTLRTQSEGEPFWAYTEVSRLVESWGYTPSALVGYASPPTTTRVRIDQRQLTTAGSDFSYAGKTEQARSQWISLTQLKSPREQTTVEYSFGTNWSATGWKQMSISWPAFTGVGTYTGDEVNLSFTNDQGAAGYWQVLTSKSTDPRAKWLVEVQRVTPDIIEGTYSITDAPLYTQKGPMTMPSSVTASGRFRVIYPR